MTEARERELLRHIRTLGLLDEATAFRSGLSENGELTGRVKLELSAKIDALAAKEGRR